MIYKPKEGSKAYEYIKDVIEAEDKEKKAYYARVEEAIGFEVGSYSGYTPNKTLTREFCICSIFVDDKTWNGLDKKLWKQTGMHNGLHKIVPIKRTKKGKEIYAAFNSFRSVTNHYKIFEDLNVAMPSSNRFSITQLIANIDKGVYLVYFDDSVRADKDNPDLVEITMSEYDELMKD